MIYNETMKLFAHRVRIRCDVHFAWNIVLSRCIGDDERCTVWCAGKWIWTIAFCMTQFQCVACAFSLSIPLERQVSFIKLSRARKWRTNWKCVWIKFVYVSNARITIIIIIDFDARHFARFVLSVFGCFVSILCFVLLPTSSHFGSDKNGLLLILQNYFIEINSHILMHINAFFQLNVERDANAKTFVAYPAPCVCTGTHIHEFVDSREWQLFNCTRFGDDKVSNLNDFVYAFENLI